MTKINIRDYLCQPEKIDSSNGTGLTQDQRDEMLEAFTLFDKNNDGLINTKDVGTVIRSIGQVPTVCEETDIVAQFAQEECYEIDYIAFVKLMKKRYKVFDEDYELRESFRRFDKEGNGFIELNDLKTMLTTIGEPLAKEEVDKWLEDGKDYIQTEKLYYEDFVTFMLSK